MIEKKINELNLKTLKKTDELHMFFADTLKESVEYIERNQLFDVLRWKNFVEVFRLGEDGGQSWAVTWRSEYWGKMMRGAAMVVRYTKNQDLYAILEDSVRDLLSTQDEDGRISGYSKESEFDSWDLWGRKYVMLGLMYFMEICEDKELNSTIISAMCRHADYIIANVGPDKRDIRKCSRHWEGLNSCSILEPMVRLYRLTGDKKYFEFAEYIISTGFILSANLIELAYDNVNPHNYPVVKAYEMMSCFEGLMQFYYLTGIEKYKTALLNFGKNIIQTELSIIGCSGCTHELFDHTSVRQTQTDYEGIVQETCVTVTWMKFAGQLLELSGCPDYADRIEQSFYNAYRGAFNTMRVPGNSSPSHQKKYNILSQIMPFDSYSPLVSDTRGRQIGGFNLLPQRGFYGCCACIGAAGAGVIPEIALMKKEKGLVINYYEQGEIHTTTPAGKPVTLALNTAYPYNGTVNFTLTLEEDEEFELSLRIPAWCDDATLTYGGKTQSCAPGYASLCAPWKNGDTLTLELPMQVKRVLPPEDAVNNDLFAAYTYGPLVLAADKRVSDPDAVLDVVCDEKGYVKAEQVPCPEIREAHICFALPLADNRTVRLIDYASAGKTWSEESRCAAWLRRK